MAWKLAQSPLCQKLYIAPGNPGTALEGENISLEILDFDGIGRFCLEREIDMVIVGPEAPLVEGIVDYFAQKPELTSIPVIGPSREAARLEGSKSFAKLFMKRHSIPTAAYKEYQIGQLDQAMSDLDRHALPLVLKADGLAAGKGVLICHQRDEAKAELRAMLEGKFGEASSTVVVEEFLQGREMSVFALSDGLNWVLLPNAKDYKRIGEGDSGPNTGGMGAICPVPFASEGLMERIKEQIVGPTVEGLQKDGLRYQGFIYFGLMIVDQEPWVIEYNCRLGDPETQAVLPMLRSDLLGLLQRVPGQQLNDVVMEYEQGFAATVILSSAGYPAEYQTGYLISGIEQARGALVFHAGTKTDENGQLRTSGGRVLAVTGKNNKLFSALEQAFTALEHIDFEGLSFRRDIGHDLM